MSVPSELVESGKSWVVLEGETVEEEEQKKHEIEEKKEEQQITELEQKYNLRKERLLKVKELFFKYFEEQFIPSYQEKKKDGWQNFWGIFEK